MSRFLGRVEQALELFSARSAKGGLDEEIDGINARANVLREALSQQEYAQRLKAAVDRVSSNITRIAAQLDVERAEAIARLETRELTIGVTDEAGREDFLWQLGSGANWLSYHVAAILALHAFFLNQPKSPVPALVIFDHPSQVYFPRRLAGRNSRRAETTLQDEDVDYIRKLFKIMGALAVHWKGRLQVIVLDHAGEEVWEICPALSWLKSGEVRRRSFQSTGSICLHRIQATENHKNAKTAQRTA